MISFPSVPAVPANQCAQAPVVLPYDQVTQAGDPKLTGMPMAIGRVCFGELWIKNPLQITRANGIFPMLSKLHIEAEPGPIELNSSVQAHGRYHLARQQDQSGQVRRIYLNMYAELTGTVGRSFGSRPANAGEPVNLGRVLSEHIFTRPFAKPDERRVTSLCLDGEQWAPPDHYDGGRPADLLQLPPGAQPLQDMTVDPTPVVYGLAHTDNNQHVNSVVYIRQFEDRALIRLAGLGQPTALVGRSVEIAYRKPSFAGDQLQLHMQAFERDGQLGVLGHYSQPGAVRPSVTVRLVFR